MAPKDSFFGLGSFWFPNTKRWGKLMSILLGQILKKNIFSRLESQMMVSNMFPISKSYMFFISISKNAIWEKNVSKTEWKGKKWPQKIVHFKNMSLWEDNRHNLRLGKSPLLFKGLKRPWISWSKQYLRIWSYIENSFFNL